MFVYLSFIFAVIVMGCNSGIENTQSNSVFFDKLNGKTLHSIDSITENVGEKNKLFVYVFNYYDCQPCIEAGMYYVKQLDSIIGASGVIAVASMVDPAPYQAKADYFEYLYVDIEDKLRKELKFIPTPQLMLINKNREIILSFMPRDTINRNRFLLEMLDKYNSSMCD